MYQSEILNLFLNELLERIGPFTMNVYSNREDAEPIICEINSKGSIKDINIADCTVAFHTDDQKFIAQFTLTSYPSCCGIKILSKLYVNTNYRKKSIATLIFNFCQFYVSRVASVLQFVTAAEINVEAQNIIEKYLTVKEKCEIINCNTSRTLHIYSYNLNNITKSSTLSTKVELTTQSVKNIFKTSAIFNLEDQKQIQSLLK